MIRTVLLMALTSAPICPQTVLVVTAHAEDYLLAAGGMLAGMGKQGASIYVVRVTNDEKTGGTSPEDAAVRARAESEEAGRRLGVKRIFHIGYRGGELGAVSPTELRDRMIFLIRQYRPDVLVLPNPYVHNDPEFDHYYTGSAAEEARSAAGLANFQPPYQEAGLKPHRPAQAYYYSLPFDPQIETAEAAPTFVPQPKVIDISASVERKLTALRALATYNRAFAGDVNSRLARTGRRLPILDGPDESAADRLLEVRVRELARKCATGSGVSLAERFLVSGGERRP